MRQLKSKIIHSIYTWIKMCFIIGFATFMAQRIRLSMVGSLKLKSDSVNITKKTSCLICLDRNYPYHPPKMNFMTKIFHPNIHYETGEICLEVLKEDGWSP